MMVCIKKDVPQKDFPHYHDIVCRITKCKACNKLSKPCRRHRVLTSLLDSYILNNHEDAKWIHFLLRGKAKDGKRLILVQSVFLPVMMLFETRFVEGQTIDASVEFHYVDSYSKNYWAGNIRDLDSGYCDIC